MNKYLVNDTNEGSIPEEITIKIPKNFNTIYTDQIPYIANYKNSYYCSLILNKNASIVKGETNADYIIIETFKDKNNDDFYFSFYYDTYNNISKNKNDKFIIIDKEGNFPKYMLKLFKYYDDYVPYYGYWNNFNCTHIETVDLGNKNTIEQWNYYVEDLPYPITVDHFINVKE